MFEESWNGHTSLEELCLIGCNLGNDFCGMLANLPPSLKNLRLTYNSIDSLGGFLTAGLPNKIEFLDLESNPITKTSEPKYLKSIEALFTRYHHFRGGAGSWFDLQLVTPYTRYLHGLRPCWRLLLNDLDCGIPASYWPSALGKAKLMGDTSEASVIYTTLREGPALLHQY
jgi:hypothetical protein